MAREIKIFGDRFTGLFVSSNAHRNDLISSSFSRLVVLFPSHKWESILHSVRYAVADSQSKQSAILIVHCFRPEAMTVL